MLNIIIIVLLRDVMSSIITVLLHFRILLKFKNFFHYLSIWHSACFMLVHMQRLVGLHVGTNVPQTKLYSYLTCHPEKKMWFMTACCLEQCRKLLHTLSDHTVLLSNSVASKGGVKTQQSMVPECLQGDIRSTKANPERMEFCITIVASSRPNKPKIHSHGLE